MTQITVDQAMHTALAHHQAGRLAEAEAIYRRVLSIDRGHPDALHLLGVIAGQCGNLDAAIDLVLQAIARRPDFAKAHNNLGNFLRQKGKHDDAIKTFHRSIEIAPNYADAFANLGATLADIKRFDQSIAACRRAIELRPDFAQAHYNLGVALVGSGRIDDAIGEFTRAVALKPESSDFHYGLANSLKDGGRFEEAGAEYKRAIQIEPKWAEAISNLGVVQKDLGQIEESIASYRRALALRPDLPEIHCNLGVVLASAQQLDESIREIERAIQIRNDYAEAHCNLGQFLLLRGDFRRGWAEYEWRWKVTTLFAPGLFAVPRWNGEDLRGKRILLHTEQGLGDAIQFVRYAPLVAGRGGRVMIECQKDLARLFAGCTGVERIVVRGETIGEVDFHCSLVTLASVFDTDLHSIPAEVPYLRADPGLSREWKKRFDDAGQIRKVGLVWAGRADHKNDRNRSIPLGEFSPLAEAKNARFFSLQKGEGSRQTPPAGMNLIDWTDDLHDFADTAALIDNLDLVISVDTSVAHLAGAMGKPVWVLLPAAPDWRWLLDREDSPWYPTMRLFRRKPKGNWAEIIQAMAGQLKSL